MHVAPFAHLFRTHNVIVSYIHAAGIGHLPIDDDNLTVIAGPDMVHPRETDGVELVDVDAVGMELLEMFFLQRLVVGVVAEAVEEGTYLHTFLPFLPEDIEEQAGDGVVAEVEVFQVDTALGLADRLEHVGKLITARHEQADTVPLCEDDTLAAHFRHQKGVAGLSMAIERNQQEQYGGYSC